MGRRILAVLVALLALLWAAVPAYASSPAVDSAYLTREPWQNVPVTEFRADGAMGYYQIYADTDNHCLYFAVSMQDQQVEPGANTAAVALNLQVSSAKFSTRKFTFTTGADKALQSYDGIASGCNMQVEILENSGGYGIADGNAYFAIALDKSLCGPLTVRLDYMRRAGHLPFEARCFRLHFAGKGNCKSQCEGRDEPINPANHNEKEKRDHHQIYLHRHSAPHGQKRSEKQRPNSA